MSEKNLLCVALVLESGQRREAKIFEDGTYRIGNGPYMKMEAQEFEMARILERRSQRTHWLMANAYEIEDVKVGSEPPADYVEDLGPFTEADFLIPDTPIVPKEAVAPEEEKNEAPEKRKKFLFFGGKKKGKPTYEPAAAEKVPDTADESPTAKWVTEEPSVPIAENSIPADASTTAAEPVTGAETPADTEQTSADAAKPDEQPEHKTHGKKKKGRGRDKKQAEAPKESGDTAQTEEPPAPTKEPQKKKPVWFVWVLIACVLLAVLGWFGGNALREHMWVDPPAPVSTPEPTPEPTPAPPARPQIYLTIDATEGAEVSGSADVDVSGVDTKEPGQDGEEEASSPTSSAVPDNKEE